MARTLCFYAGENEKLNPIIQLVKEGLTLHCSLPQLDYTLNRPDSHNGEDANDDDDTAYITLNHKI